ncbi:hypothetical protein [Paenibacillus sp. HB172176]|uniref:hypothetical protein n=1 Tax=Paenibacillus sp. HB172176 TaxID=2493690 RepID=UPI001438A68E|nr:hypothetical protein [Paenibacillus sp. HB172176]
MFTTRHYSYALVGMGLILCMIETGCAEQQMDASNEVPAHGDVYESEKIECGNADACAAWGDQIAEELETRYGSFVDMRPLELSEEEEELSDAEEDILAVYKIDGDRFLANKTSTDTARHEQLWNDFTRLIPSEERQEVTAFEIFSHVDTVAYAVQDEDDRREWTVGINIDPEIMTPQEKVATLFHEFGHLLTLNSSQVNPSAKERGCSTLYLDEGCADEDAYVLAFHSQFWPEAEYEYSDKQFVSEYAAVDFVEDLAESWMNFVLTDKPAGKTVAERKILFFYDYDELVMLRAELLARASSWMGRYGANNLE